MAPAGIMATSVYPKGPPGTQRRGHKRLDGYEPKHTIKRKSLGHTCCAKNSFTTSRKEAKSRKASAEGVQTQMRAEIKGC